ncbi:MAG: hypothetical protein J6Z49_05455 [Kiritimatiellae bacterium]|nr:hypothetical protein [Kiritimatiellia bacterium]
MPEPSLTSVQEAIAHLLPQNDAKDSVRSLFTALNSVDEWSISFNEVERARTLRGIFSKIILGLHALSFYSAPFDDAFGADARAVIDVLDLKNGEVAQKVKEAFAEEGIKIIKCLNGPWKKSKEKNAAGEKLKSLNGQWCGLFSTSESLSEFAFYLNMDDILCDKRTLSLDDAMQYLKGKSCCVGTEDERRFVAWYLNVVRVKYRHDLTLKVAQVACPKGHGKHDEGVECPQCREAEDALEAAKRALKEKNWAEAKAKASKVSEIWPDNAEAKQICEKVTQMLDDANQEIQVALGDAAAEGKGFSKVRDKVKETAGRNLPGFDAVEWRRKIDEAEEKAKRKRKEREVQECADKIAALKKNFKEALVAWEWDKAREIGRELANLGEGTIADWDAEVDAERKNRRAELEKARDGALAAFTEALAHQDTTGAEEALTKAKDTQDTLRKEFGSPSSPRISNAEKALADKKRELLIEGLRKVESLTAKGSTDGPPVIIVSWKPTSGGTAAAKWRILRREKGASGKGVMVDELNASMMSHTDRGRELKIGVEYEYGIVPMVEIDKKFRENEKAIVWSNPAVCLVELPDGSFSGTGQGMDGAGGIVTLKWTMPEGLSAGVPYRFLLSRGDGKISNKDVTSFSGVFEDADVSVGASFDYSLRFEFFGRDMGTSKISVEVRKVPPPPTVGRITFGRTASGALLVKWDWPDGLDSCIWGVSDAKACSPSDIPKISRHHVSRARYAEKGGVLAKPLDGGGPCWISVFGVRSFGDRDFCSAGRSAPLWETKLTYDIETHPGGLFSKRKPAFLVIKTSTGYIPELDVRASRIRADVLSPRGGRSAIRTESETGMPEKRILLDGIVRPGEFVGVFLVHADAENCRLHPPSEFEVQ